MCNEITQKKYGRKEEKQERVRKIILKTQKELLPEVKKRLQSQEINIVIREYKLYQKVTGQDREGKKVSPEI